MYLIFRSSDPTLTNQPVQSVELSVSAPTYLQQVTPTGTVKPDAYVDQCYLNVDEAFRTQTEDERAAYIQNVFDHVTDIILTPKVMNVIAVVRDQVRVPTSGSGRTKLTDWNSMVDQAWIRAAHHSDLLHI